MLVWRLHHDMGEASSIPVKCFASAVRRAVGQHSRIVQAVALATVSSSSEIHVCTASIRVFVFFVVLCRMWPAIR